MKEQTIFAPNHVDKKSEHYVSVKKEMLKRGPPQIRAMYNGCDAWLAIEGSHRIAAAEELGLNIIILEVKPDEVISDHDFEDLSDEVKACEIWDYCDPGVDYRMELVI